MYLALHLLRLVRALTRDRTRLALENLALRQQLAALQRNVERPSLNDSERLFWTMACEFLTDWKECLVIVKPDTAMRRRRATFWTATAPSTPSRTSAGCTTNTVVPESAHPYDLLCRGCVVPRP